LALAQLDTVLWVGGAQWAGKTTVARLLAARYPLVVYAYDYHDARSHAARARANADRFPAYNAFLAALDADPDRVWSDPSPELMAERELAVFSERFQMVLEDLAALPEATAVLAEGWGLRPDLVAPHLATREQAIFLIPTESFRQSQLGALGRAKRLSIGGLREPARAQRNRVERDRLLADDVVARAGALGLPVLEVDGTQTELAVAGGVEKQFRPFLPTWLY
jgi:hypothetical protein